MEIKITHGIRISHQSKSWWWTYSFFESESNSQIRKSSQYAQMKPFHLSNIWGVCIVCFVEWWTSLIIVTHTRFLQFWYSFEATDIILCWLNTIAITIGYANYWSYLCAFGFHMLHILSIYSSSRPIIWTINRNTHSISNILRILYILGYLCRKLDCTWSKKNMKYWNKNKFLKLKK